MTISRKLQLWLLTAALFAGIMLTLMFLILMFGCSPTQQTPEVQRSLTSGSCVLVWEQAGIVDGWDVCKASCHGWSCQRVAQMSYPVVCGKGYWRVRAVRGELMSDWSEIIQ